MRPVEVTATTLVMAVTNVMGYAVLLDRNEHLVATSALVTAIVAVSYLVLWFFWRGRNWARLLVLATSVLALLNVFTVPSANVLTVIMIVIEALTALFLLYWLNTARAKAFFTPSDRVAAA